MKRLSGGIDIGKDTHHVLILDEKEEIIYQKKMNLPRFTGQKDKTIIKHNWRFK